MALNSVGKRCMAILVNAMWQSTTAGAIKGGVLPAMGKPLSTEVLVVRQSTILGKLPRGPLRCRNAKVHHARGFLARELAIPKPSRELVSDGIYISQAKVGRTTRMRSATLTVSLLQPRRGGFCQRGTPHGEERREDVDHLSTIYSRLPGIVWRLVIYLYIAKSLYITTMKDGSAS